jgi:4-amino-4-deoxy-L-arabinose transferase-like glycosyltransferase
MTYFAGVARLVSVTMSVATVYCISRITRLMSGTLASAIAASIATLDAVLVYYGHTTNLDGPYLFWSVVAMLLVMEGIANHRPYRIAGSLPCFFAAVATKDQAFALALFALPVVFICWAICDDWVKQNWRAILKPAATTFLAGAIVFSLLSGAVVNPTGFARRLTFLTGTASANNANYAANIHGYLRVLYDGLMNLGNHYPMPFMGLGLYGIIIYILRFRKNDPTWVAGLLPLLAIASFTLCFNFVALRTDDRFLLPHSLLLSVYIGIGSAHLLTTGPRFWRGIVIAALSSIFAGAVYAAASVDAAFLHDPRYDAEDWLARYAAHATVETYGKNVYLPRFPATLHLTRVGTDDVAERSPLAFATEIKQPFDGLESRRPDIIVVSTAWVFRYLVSDDAPEMFGRAHSALQRELFGETDARKFFKALMNGRRNYCVAHVAKFNSSVWSEVHIHQSLNESIVILRRDERSCSIPAD